MIVCIHNDEWDFYTVKLNPVQFVVSLADCNRFPEIQNTFDELFALTTRHPDFPRRHECPNTPESDRLFFKLQRQVAAGITFRDNMAAIHRALPPFAQRIMEGSVLA